MLYIKGARCRFFDRGIVRSVLVVVLLEWSAGSAVRAQSHLPVSSAPKLEPAERNAVIDTLVEKVNDYYVFPDVAKKMTDAIRQRQRHHDYDTVSSREVLAKLLTADLYAISKDGHLGVESAASPVMDQDPGAPPDSVVNQFKRRWAADNFGFRKVERLEGNVGLLQVDAFFPSDWIKDLAQSSMTFLANTDAIIIDVRKNHGFADGGFLIASYFFSDPVHWNDNYDREAKTLRQSWTLPVVPGPKLSDKDLYILVSKDCFSASEDFAYNLQALGRAKVIGEVTGGGAHPTKPYKIGTYFVADIPFAYSVNPVTHTDWEGKGVQPDVKVPADQALLTAQLMAIRASIRRFGADTDRLGNLQRIAEEKQKELDTLKAKEN